MNCSNKKQTNTPEIQSMQLKTSVERSRIGFDLLWNDFRRERGRQLIVFRARLIENVDQWFLTGDGLREIFQRVTRAKIDQLGNLVYVRTSSIGSIQQFANVRHRLCQSTIEIHETFVEFLIVMIQFVIENEILAHLLGIR